MIREGVLELAFDGYKKARGFPVFTATLKETRFVYEHHFIAEFLRWLFAIWPAGSGRYGGTPELVIRGERVALTLPESRRRFAAVRFDCRSLVAVRRGIKGVVAVPETTVIDVDAAVSGGGVATEDFLGSPCGGFVSPERRIGDLRDLRVTIKLQFTHEIVVELSVSKKVELALTRDQYACAVALFFGNMGEDDGDGATAKWWQETPYGAGAPRGVPEAWFASGSAPHALAATLGCSWKVEGGGLASEVDVQGFLRVLEPGADERAAWAATPRRWSTNALTYDHRTNCAANWVGVWLGALAVRAPPSRVRAVVGFLFGGFRRAQRCVPPRPVDAYATFFEHWQSELVVDFGDVVWEQRGAAGPRAASVDVESARITRVVTETTTRIAVHASLRGAFLSTARGRPLRRLAEPCELRYDRRATFASSDFDAAPYESASEASLAGKEGPVDVCGDGADARALLDVVAALARDDPAPGAPEAVVMLWAAAPWAADLGRVDLSPPAHADSRGTFAARVVVRAHALAFRARRRLARELAVALTGADGSPSLARRRRWTVWRARHWDGDDDVELAERLDRLVCRHRVPGGGALIVAFRRRAARRASPRPRRGVAAGDDGLVGDDGASSDDESDGDGRAGDGGDDGVFLAAVSAELGDGGGPWTFAGPRSALRPGGVDAGRGHRRLRRGPLRHGGGAARRDLDGARLVAGDEDHFSRAPPARTTSRDAAPEPDDDDVREARPWSVEISLGPLLVFRNGLPVPLAWELVGGGHRRGVLPADAEAPYRGDAPSVSLRVRIANYAWSPPLEIALRALRVCHALEATLDAQDRAPPVAFACDAAARRALVADWGAVVPWDPCARRRRVATEPIRVVFCDASKAPVDLPAPAVRVSCEAGRAAAGGAARRRRRADDDGAAGRVDDADSGGKSAPHTHRAAREADAAAASLSLNCPRPRGRVPASYELSVAVAADGAGAAPRSALATLLPRVTVRNGLADCVLEVGQVAVDGGDHVLRLRPRAEGQLRWASASAPRLVCVRATFRGGAALVSGALRVDGFGRRGETAFKLHDPAAPRRRRRRAPRAPIGGAAEASPTFAAKRPSSAAAAETLEKNAHSLRDALVGGAASALLGGDPKAPRRKSTYASEAYESAQSTAKYLGSKVHKGARKMGVVAASHEEQTVAPWTELRPNDEHVYAWERPLDAVGYGSKSYRRALQVEFYDATRDEWGSNLNVPLDALSTAAAPSKEAKLRRAAGAAAPDLGAAGLDYRPVERRHPYLPETWVGGVAAVDASTAVLYVFGDAKRSFLAAVADLRTEARRKPRRAAVRRLRRARPAGGCAGEEGFGLQDDALDPRRRRRGAEPRRAADAIGADFEGRGPLVESDECPVVLFVFLELKRRYAGAEVVSVEVWSERLSAFGFLTSRLPLVRRLVAEEFLVPDAGGGFSTAGYALADRDADADRASSPYVCVASPKDGVLASLKAEDAAAALARSRTSATPSTARAASTRG
ncbi:hypothetical protein JL721_1793 [Aureococcus anophagefferens]|nr:hypothetical protein JL721_1793 [Aureococcus anophagefferens]